MKNNNKEIEKKKEEKDIILPLFEKLHIGQETIEETESPDFTFIYEGKKVGIELVRICPSKKFGNNKNSITASNRKKINMALEGYRKVLCERNENIVLDIQFTPSTFWTKEDFTSFVGQVIAEIDYVRNQKKSECVINCCLDTKFVNDVVLVPAKSDKPIVFSCNGQALQRITQEDFDNCINEKISLIKKYKRDTKNIDINEYWLAIAIHNSEPYEFWDYPYMLPKALEFKRVYTIQYDGIKEQIVR